MIVRPTDPVTVFQGKVLAGAADTNANGVELIGAVTGSGVQVAAFGDDTNIGIALVPKGSGAVTITAPVAGSLSSRSCSGENPMVTTLY